MNRTTSGPTRHSLNSPGHSVRVPFYDAARANRDTASQSVSALETMLDDGWFILGPKLEAFESCFARYCGARYCIGVGNGLDAITLLLKGLGIGEGDEVIVPAQTFIATFLGVSATGAKPVAVDVDPGSCNISPERVLEAVTPRTRAVIAVHLFGRQAAMTALSAIARARNFHLIEDAAQAHGLNRIEGAAARGASVAATYSFYPTKNLGGLGDGGAVTTDDADLAARISGLRNYGSTEKYIHEVRGINSRLDDLQAAFLSTKLPHLDRWNQRRRDVAARYASALADLAPSRCRMLSPPDACSVWHHVVLMVEDRAGLQRHLSDRGIGTAVHYPLVPPKQKAYAKEFEGQSFPVAEDFARRALSLPVGSYLRDEEVDVVASAIIDYYVGRS